MIRSEIENKLTLNADTIVSVNLKDEVLNHYWVWGNETTKQWSWKKFKYLKTYNEGFYDLTYWPSWERSYYSKQQLEDRENVIIDGHEVYEKASVTITLLSGDKTTKYFRNFSEALNFNNMLVRKISNKVEI